MDLRQRAAGILCGFQGFLTQNPAAFVEIDDIFDFSAAPSIVFSIAHTTIHSKCGVKQFVCPQSVLGCQTWPALAYSVYGLQQADAAPIKANSGSNADPGAF
jgi:hypothetical protein